VRAQVSSSRVSSGLRMVTCTLVVLASSLWCSSCTEPKKLVVGRVSLINAEDGYHLQHPDQQAGSDLGPVEEIGWRDQIVVVRFKAWGWRIVDANSLAGLRTVLSADEVRQRIQADPHLRGLTTEPTDQAWRRLATGP
jgi:hypothetical protein